MDALQCCEEAFGHVEPQHVGSVGFGDSGVGMGFHKDAVATHGYGCPADGFYHFGVAYRDTRGLVGTLEGVGDIDDYRHAVALHDGYAAEIDDEVLVAEGGAALGEHDVLVAEVLELVHGVCHGLGREELAFLYVDAASREGCGFEQRGLTAEEGRYLQYIDIGGCHCGFLLAVDVGDDGDAVAVAYGLEDVEAGLVSDACEGVDARAVGFAVGRFEGIGYMEPRCDVGQLFGNEKRGLLVFYNARTGNKEEIAGLGMVQMF